MMTLSVTPLAAEKTFITVGTIRSIEKDYIIIDDQKYTLLNNFTEEKTKAQYDFETEYWIVTYDSKKKERMYQVNFRTLAGVGWVAKARVTLQGSLVRKIEVLDLEM
jgi:hypothetical protein